jgi:four helix bundle protein
MSGPVGRERGESSYGSLMEVASQSMIAHRQSFINEECLKVLYEKAEELARMLSGPRGKLKQASETKV